MAKRPQFTLSFAPGFLGNSIYFRHTVDFPDGKPNADQIAAVRSFMAMVDRTLSRRCEVAGLEAAREECASIACQKTPATVPAAAVSRETR